MNIRLLKKILIVCFFVLALGLVFVLNPARVEQNNVPSPTTSPTSSPIFSPVTPTSTPDYSTDALLRGMKLTFREEFNSFSRYLDLKGNITCGPGGEGIWQTVFHFCSRTIPSNSEAEVYIDQNFLDYLNVHAGASSTAVSPFSITNGILAIEARPSDAIIRKQVGDWAKYTSGLITTQFSFSQIYGYFEMRAKLPVGQGLWPAFWLLPTNKNWPPEIDVMEAFGGANPKGEGGFGMIHYASHSPTPGQFCGAWVDRKIDVTKDFHTYGVNWQPTGITYYFDGQPYATCPPNPHANTPFYLLINLAVGGEGSWPGVPASNNSWPATFFIDYVRAYQKI